MSMFGPCYLERQEIERKKEVENATSEGIES